MAVRQRALSLLAWLPWFRPKTAEELSREAERRAIREQNAKLKRAALLYADIIRERLTRLGIAWEYTQRSGKSGFQEVKWRTVTFNTEAIYLEVDTVRLPRLVNSARLITDEVIQDLSLACRRPVTWSLDENTGLWYIIELEKNVRGIPSHVAYADMLSHYPKTAGPLDVPIGVGANRKYIYRNLAKFPHLLIAGTTGGGKSTWENAILCSLIRRNDPRRLKMVMVDLKGGNELSFYAGIPHLMTPIIETRERAIDALRLVRRVVDFRLSRFKGKFRDIAAYNFSHRAHPLPRIVFMIDEWGDMALDRKLGGEAEELLTGLAQRCRSVGVHIIVCTQFPKREVVSTRIKANMPARVAFSCADNNSSMVILDSSAATHLTPQGRMVFAWQSQQIECQAPYINDAMVAAIVADVIAGNITEVEDMGPDVTEQDILEFGLEELGGDLNKDKIFAHFRERGLTHSATQEMLRAMEGREVIVNGSLYRVAPSPGGPIPRRLLPVVEAESPNGGGMRNAE